MTSDTMYQPQFQQAVKRRIQSQLQGQQMTEPVTSMPTVMAQNMAPQVPSPEFVQPQMGQERTFANGRRGRWDGKGWLHVG